MKKVTLLLSLTFLLSVPLSIMAQISSVVPVVERKSNALSTNLINVNYWKMPSKTDLATVHRASAIRLNMMEDVEGIKMKQEDILNVSHLLSKVKSIKKVSPPTSINDCIFLDCGLSDFLRWGCYVTKSHIYLSLENCYDFYKLAFTDKEENEKFISIVNSYAHKFTTEAIYCRYDNLSIMPRINYSGGCMFSRFNTISFYVLRGPSTIRRIDYVFSKKKNTLTITRNILPFDDIKLNDTETDQLNTPNENEGSYETILKAIYQCFPEWRDSSNEEKMRMLDSYICKQGNFKTFQINK